MAKSVERKYFIPSKRYEYLFTHPQPGMLVVEVANAKDRQGQQSPTPKLKEAKKMDLFGHKVFSTGGLQFRLADQHVILNHDNCSSWNTLSKFKELLSADSHSNFGAILEEGKAIAKTSLQAALDSADVRMLSTTIAM
ncbi:hypothetical protein UY3_03855 [Chelonia mydas]|uniref:Uncharacterized protein n=1 Tax=Chelonia mydas TaxID=8469 RepID=M7C3A0_CHEMY|nr:hypothetical protein UY3_03855 [Chelonia mydas]